jgi:hypothetical protein
MEDDPEVVTDLPVVALPDPPANVEQPTETTETATEKATPETKTETETEEAGTL